MTLYEITYLCLAPFMPPLLTIVRKRLREFAASYRTKPDFLDVGGRKSPYTIGVPARITITDLPRETEVQQQFGHGLTQEIIEQVYKRRSNVHKILLDDMTRSTLPDCSFDLVVAVEVLEHVEDDGRFVQQVYRVLKPGGVFLMTTPNGDHPGRNPARIQTDFVCGIPLSAINKRWYTREHLSSVLSSCFDIVEIEYAVTVGKFHTLGLNSWSIKHPLQTALSMMGSFVNSIKSAREEVKKQAVGTRHLIAVARKLS